MISSYLSVIGLTLYFTAHKTTKTSPTVILLNLIYVERQQSKKKPERLYICVVCIYGIHTHAQLHHKKRKSLESHTNVSHILTAKSQTKPNKKWKHLFQPISLVLLYSLLANRKKKNILYIYTHITHIWPFACSTFFHSQSPFRQVKISFGLDTSEFFNIAFLYLIPLTINRQKNANQRKYEREI